MCTGFEIAALASTVGGSLLNHKIQNDAIKAQNQQNRMTLELERAARERETARQQGFERDQAELVTQALFEAAPEKVMENVERVVEDPEAPINAAVDDFNTTELAGQVQNQDVNQNIGATIAAKTAQTRELLRNAATLSGMFDSFNNTETALGRMGSEIQTIGSNRRGSLDASRQETRLPTPTVTASDSPIGDLLVLGGSALGGWAGNRAGASGAAKPFDIGGIFSRNRPLNAIPALGRVV